MLFCLPYLTISLISNDWSYASTSMYKHCTMYADKQLINSLCIYNFIPKIPGNKIVPCFSIIKCRIRTKKTLRHYILHKMK